MAVAATTELEAINIMLAAIGESPVNSLIGTLPVDVKLAQSTLITNPTLSISINKNTSLLQSPYKRLQPTEE